MRFGVSLSRLCAAVAAAALMGVSGAMAQESFFSGDFFIEEDVMVEGSFDSDHVTETYEERVEEADEDERGRSGRADEDTRRGQDRDDD